MGYKKEHSDIVMVTYFYYSILYWFLTEKGIDFLLIEIMQTQRLREGLVGGASWAGQHLWIFLQSSQTGLLLPTKETWLLEINSSLNECNLGLHANKISKFNTCKKHFFWTLIAIAIIFVSPESSLSCHLQQFFMGVFLLNSKALGGTKVTEEWLLIIMWNYKWAESE